MYILSQLSVLFLGAVINAEHKVARVYFYITESFFRKKVYIILFFQI